MDQEHHIEKMLIILTYHSSYHLNFVWVDIIFFIWGSNLAEAQGLLAPTFTTGKLPIYPNKSNSHKFYNFASQM